AEGKQAVQPGCVYRRLNRLRCNLRVEIEELKFESANRTFGETLSTARDPMVRTKNQADVPRLPPRFGLPYAINAIRPIVPDPARFENRAIIVYAQPVVDENGPPTDQSTDYLSQ
ncbi:MAG TPA: hypothetical protein DEB39_01245, partial [Planctomycetaceae bacterium]|nr:hypothetical protein [Planctomycetaceae bacterium]